MSIKTVQLIENIPIEKALKLFDLTFNFNNKDLNERYKKLAFKFHPDHGGSILKMQELNNAKLILEMYLRNKNRKIHKRKHISKTLTKRNATNASYIQISLMILISYVLIVFLFS